MWKAATCVDAQRGRRSGSCGVYLMGARKIATWLSLLPLLVLLSAHETAGQRGTATINGSSVSLADRDALLNVTAAQPFDLAAAYRTSSASLQPLPSFPGSAPFVAFGGLNPGVQAVLVRLPTGPFYCSTRITVQPGQVVVLQGTGGVVEDTNNQTPASMWLPAEESCITVAQGGALLLANVTLIAPVLAGANSTAAFLPRTFVTYPSNSTVSNTTSPASLPAFALDSVTLILSDCGMLQDYQTLMCGLDIETDVPPWPGFEAEPGWMFLWNLNLYTPAAVNISYWRTLMTCSYPTPPLAVGLYQTVSPSNAPSAPPVIQDAAWNNTLMFTNPDGKIVDSGGNPVATLPALPVLGNSTDGVRPQQCAARRIADSQQLLRGVVELQTQSEGYVILQMVRNISLTPTDYSSNLTNGSSTSNGTQSQAVMPGSFSAPWRWPAHNTTLRVYRNVTIQGNITNNITEFDVALRRFTFHVQNTTDNACLAFQQLALANMPGGPDDLFPTSIFAAPLWFIIFNRTMSNDTLPTRVLLTNVTLILPQDSFNFTLYWTGIMASPVPSVRALASWEGTYTQGLGLITSYAADLQGGVYAPPGSNDTVILRYRSAPRTFWVNVTLTDTPVVAPLRRPASGIGKLVPNDPTFPYAFVTPVYNASQLVQYLQAPPNPVLILLNNISLSQESANISWPLQLAPVPGSIVSAVSQAGASWPGAPGNSPLVIGAWDRPTVLDLGNASPLVQLNTSAQLSFKRLTLTGLGRASPSDPADVPPEMSNYTSALWAFFFNRRQQLLSLSNVTMLVPQHELDVLAAFSNNGNGTLNATNNAGLNGLVIGVRQSWAASSSTLVSPTNLSVTSVNYLGISLTSCSVVSALDPSLAAAATLGVRQSATNVEDLYISPVLPPAVLLSTTGDPSTELPALLAGFTAPPPSSGGGGGGGGDGAGLNNWRVAVLSAGCAVAGLVLLSVLAGWLYVRHRRKKRRQAAADEEAMKGVIALAGAPAGPEGGLMPGTGSPYDKSGRTTPASQQLCLVVPGIGTPAMRGPSTDSYAAASIAAAAAAAAAAGVAALPASGHSDSTAASGAAHTASLSSPPSQNYRASSSLGRPSNTLMPLHEQSNQASGDGSSNAPDDEIRQLVHAQRARAIATSRTQSSGVAGPRGGAIDLEGVTLEEVLGQGSFGVVYRGRWRGMTVAVKTLLFHDAGPAARRARQRAVNEAAINTLLSHDCICNMYAYDLRPMAPAGLPDDKFNAHYRLYIIQEFCDAGSLAQAIDRGVFVNPATGRRKLPQIVQIALDVARGLAYIHDRNVIHGDLSSGNIMLRRDPAAPLGVQAKVCDFGLSRFLEGPEQSHISNVRQGTPYYIAPEVMAHSIISREADVFSFGVVLWEMFHAQLPPWRDPAVLRAAAERLQMGPPGGTGASEAGPAAPRTLVPPTAVAAVLQETRNDILVTAADVAPPQMETVGTADTAVLNPAALLPRPMLQLDPTRPSGFSYPLPPDCPKAYADLVAACLHPIPKARPRMTDAVSTLRSLLLQVDIQGVDQFAGHSSSGNHPTSAASGGGARTPPTPPQLYRQPLRASGSLPQGLIPGRSASWAAQEITIAEERSGSSGQGVTAPSEVAPLAGATAPQVGGLPPRPAQITAPPPAISASAPGSVAATDASTPASAELQRAAILAGGGLSTVHATSRTGGGSAGTPTAAQFMPFSIPMRSASVSVPMEWVPAGFTSAGSSTEMAGSPHLRGPSLTGGRSRGPPPALLPYRGGGRSARGGPIHASGIGAAALRHGLGHPDSPGVNAGRRSGAPQQPPAPVSADAHLGTAAYAAPAPALISPGAEGESTAGAAPLAAGQSEVAPAAGGAIPLPPPPHFAAYSDTARRTRSLLLPPGYEPFKPPMNEPVVMGGAAAVPAPPLGVTSILMPGAMPGGLGGVSAPGLLGAGTEGGASTSTGLTGPRPSLQRLSTGNGVPISLAQGQGEPSGGFPLAAQIATIDLFDSVEIGVDSTGNLRLPTSELTLH